jgi:S-formylglutathione hydrolase FrmB
MKFFNKLFLFTFLCLAYSMNSMAAKVDTIELRSEKMQKMVKAAVVTPQSYTANQTAYPVLYLLHGGTGSFRDWLNSVPDKQLLHKLADQYNIIIVTPDGGPTSYYFDSPLDASSQYETFISKELVEKIDASYRTVKDKKGRVIAGLSMGGHGAMYIAARHPELYSAVGSMSGVMDINTATWKVPEEFARSRSEYFVKLLGPPKEGSIPYPGHTIIDMTDQLKASGLAIIVDCGVDDFLIETNRHLHQLLVTNEIPHDYIERPGRHDWKYWENALYYQMLFFHKVLESTGVNIP